MHLGSGRQTVNEYSEKWNALMQEMIQSIETTSKLVENEPF